MMQGRDFFSYEATGDDIDPQSPDEEDPPTTKKKKCKNRNRFSDEQVRSLETIFESETKLEPRKKVQVARELGLQPRQVAIWFQNKRARWKSKQIEKSYRLLKSNYENLKTRLEVVKKDKESLLTQLQELRSVVERSHEGKSGCQNFMANSKGSTGEQNNTDAGLTEKTSSIQEKMNQEGIFHSDDDKTGNMVYLKQEEPELHNIEGSMISPVKWCSFDAGSFIDQSSTNSHWWEYWT